MTLFFLALPTRQHWVIFNLFTVVRKYTQRVYWNIEAANAQHISHNNTEFKCDVDNRSTRIEDNLWWVKERKKHISVICESTLVLTEVCCTVLRGVRKGQDTDALTVERRLVIYSEMKRHAYSGSSTCQSGINDQDLLSCGEQVSLKETADIYKIKLIQ
jgi:hypothetical protein